MIRNWIMLLVMTATACISSNEGAPRLDSINAAVPPIGLSISGIDYGDWRNRGREAPFYRESVTSPNYFEATNEHPFLITVSSLWAGLDAPSFLQQLEQDGFVCEGKDTLNTSDEAWMCSMEYFEDYPYSNRSGWAWQVSINDHTLRVFHGGGVVAWY